MADRTTSNAQNAAPHEEHRAALERLVAALARQLAAEAWRAGDLDASEAGKP